jgi:DNA-binding transcriptional MocR family regulator
MAPHLVEPGTIVLHGLRLKGFAETDVLAQAAGLDDVTVVRALEALAEEGMVRRRQGVEVSGWVLTPQGRAEHEKRLADELAATGARPEIEAAYGEFTVLNPELLALCTDWQLRPEGTGTINDHTDPAYDQAVIARLQDLHQRALPVVAALGSALPRYQGYPARLQHAVDRVVAGDRDWFSRPMIDSYHTVWFELHEDLLATLGLQRADDQEG